MKAGDALPPLDIAVTATLVMGGALASRDYTPVHHDPAAAQAQGMPNMFMNILTTKGLVGRYVTDWTGPNAVVKGVWLKLGGPCMPGDTLKLRGKVLSATPELVEVEVAGNNSWGSHVTAKVRVQLPSN
ncbi:MAG: acyl dehydratase [Deltaproteobacteria bacterium]|nr:acyl dehydratase [Deltaproteobacteria bacterium]